MLTENLLKVKRRSALFFLLAVVVVGAGLVVWTNFRAKPVLAQWWDDNWAYRQAITITNNGTAQTNYQVQVVLGTGDLIAAGKMQSDCDDIRLTDPSGKLLAYWSEYCRNGAGQNSSIWVTLPTLSAGSSYIYVYYGNPAATSVSVFRSLPTGINVGDGADQAATVSGTINLNTTSISGRATADAVLTSLGGVNAGSTSIVVGSATGFGVGDEVLLMTNRQLGGTSRVGQYETARITVINGTTFTLNRPLIYTYDANDQDRVQRIPNYTKITVCSGNDTPSGQGCTASGTLNPSQWFSGGVLFFRSTGTADVSGTVSVTGFGSNGGSGGLGGTGGGYGGKSGEDYSNQSDAYYGGGAENSLTPTTAGGNSGNDGSASPNNGGVFGGGGGGGSDGSGNSSNGGGGGGGGGGYAGGGGGGGGNADSSGTGGTGGSGGSTGTSAGGGGGGCRGATTTAGAGGNAGSAGSDANCASTNGTGGQVGSGTTSGSGGGGSTFQGSGGGGGGGGTYGAAALSTLYFGGGGGGGGGTDDSNAGGAGGDGGGIVYISADTITITGSVTANGDAGSQPATAGGSGGGGAGGSVYFAGRTLTLGSNRATATGGSGGGAGTRIAGGGSGGIGRIHLSYSASTGSTNPTADTSTLPIAGSPSSEEKGPGPIAYWRLDDGTGTTGQDSSANNYDLTLNGVVNNPTWQTEDMCVSGKCLYFEGSNATASAVATTISNLQSVSFWAKPASSSGTIPFISFSSGTGTIAISSSNLAVSTSGITSPTTYVNGAATTTLTANNWNYVVITTGTAFTATNPVLGKVHLTYFKGFMDEVKLYNYARSAAQIALDYNAKAGAMAKGTGSLLGAQTTEALNKGLVGYWKMDETAQWATDCSTTSVTDSSGNANNGKPCPNASAPSIASGSANSKFGSGGSFDGTNDYVDVGNGSSLQVTGALTLAAWVNLTTNNAVHDIIAKNGASGSFAYRLYTDASGKANMEVSTDGTNLVTATGATTLSTSTWYHLVGVFNPGASVVIYVNGVADATTTASAPWTVSNPSTNLNLGAENAGASNFLSGKLDEARIYNRALSPAEIQQLYNWAPGPVAYWTFNDGQGTTVTDFAGNSNGTWGGTSQHWQPGKYGFGGSFGGQTPADRVTAGKPAIFNFLHKGDFTVSFWLYAQSSSAPDYNIINKDNNGQPGWAIMVAGTPVCGTGSKMVLRVGRATTNLTQYSTTAIPCSLWVHYTVVWSASTPLATWYRNGVLDQGTTTVGSGTIGDDSARNVEMGRQNGSGTSRDFNGLLDDVRIYNYARTPGQIVADMNAGHPLGGSPVASMQDYWKFDAGFSPGATSSGIQQTTGTLTNMALPTASVGTSGWQKDGKFGGGVAFDGSNDFVDFGDMSYLESVGTMSATFWVNPNALAQKKCFLCKFQQASAASKESIAIETGVTNGNAVMVELSTDGNAATASGETAGGVLSVGSWTHVAVVYDANQLGNANKLKIYINGLQKTLTFSGTIPDSLQATTSNLRAGASSDSTSARNFSGQLDEIKVYSGALSSSDVLVDYNQGSGITLGSFGTTGATTASSSAGAAYCVPGDTSSCGGPFWETNFEETVAAISGGTATFNDSSGNGRIATPVSAGSPTLAMVPGKIGRGYRQDSTSTAGVAIQTSNTYAPPAQITMEAWVYQKSPLNSNGTQVVTGMQSGGYFLNVNGTAGATSGMLNIRFRSIWTTNGTWVVNAVVPFNQWTHLAVTYNTGATTNNPKIYVNGVIRNLDSTTSPTGSWTNTTSNLDIHGQSGAGVYFNGIIDRVLWYNYVRTPAQIAWDYTRGLPSTWWKFDECQGTVENDAVGTVSGTITAGTIGDCNTASTAWKNGVTGKNNYSLSFGSAPNASKVVSANTYPLAGAATTNASWGGWFKPTSSVNSQAFIEKQNQFRLYTDGSGNAICGIYNGGAYADSSSVTAPVTLNAWNHMICTFDGANIKTYVNGILKNTTANTTNIAVGTTNLYVGQLNDGTNQFTGQADDVKVWNYDLTAYQVRLDYNQGSAVRFGPSTGAP